MVKYKIDLVRIFNKTYSSRELRDKLRIYISRPDFKRFFGESVISEIATRTQDKRLDKNNKKLDDTGPYSKQYQDSFDFKAYGKNKDRIDLTLTGEMLTSMESKSSGKTEITLQFINERNAAKAQGHRTGRYGKKGKSEPRDFFGLPEEELTKIMKQSIKIFRDESLEQLADVGLPTFPISTFTSEPAQVIQLQVLSDES